MMKELTKSNKKSKSSSKQCNHKFNNIYKCLKCGFQHIHDFTAQIAFDWTGEAYEWGLCEYCGEKDM